MQNLNFELPPLPFPRNALEPYISAQTIDYHYNRHHRAYVDNTNAQLAEPENQSRFGDVTCLEDLVRAAPPGKLLDNAAQAWNHEFYWHCLTPHRGKPRGELLTAVNAAFRSTDNLGAELIRAATSVFGSGWAWLVCKPGGTLAIETTGNADTPIRHGKTPLLTIDVWEHAYYLDYRNDRRGYLDNIKNLLNWEEAERTFLQTRSAAA